MFVLTIDQIDSRHHDDRVTAALSDVEARFSPWLTGAAERTAGDEFQVATTRGGVALDIALRFARSEEWSIGLGIGGVTLPLGDSVRAMTGSAFINAREAVTAAKKRPARFALVADPGAVMAQSLDPLIRLLITLRDRRTPEGWELFDLLEGDRLEGDRLESDRDIPLTLTAAAERLGITVQAASQRALAAGLRLDREARDSLASMLDIEGEKIDA
jgi:hypothetical protein